MAVNPDTSNSREIAFTAVQYVSGNELVSLTIYHHPLAGAAARVTWTDLLALAPGREDLSTLG